MEQPSRWPLLQLPAQSNGRIVASVAFRWANRWQLLKDTAVIRRERTTSGALLLHASACSYEIHRAKPGVLYMAIAGNETCQLGRAPLGEVAAEASQFPSLRLFIDMTRLNGIAPEVSDDWTAWFKATQQSIAKVHAFVESPLVQLTVAVSQLVSRTGNLIRVHTDRAAFDTALAEVAPEFQRPPVQLWPR